MDRIQTSIESEEVRKMYENKVLALSEVVLAYLSVIGLMWINELIPGFKSWQQEFMGRAIVSAMIYMALPAVLLVYAHGLVESPGAIVFKAKKIKKSLFAGIKALAVMFPATFAFPIAEMFGWGFTDWGGAAIIAAFYLAAVAGVLWLFKNESTVKENSFSSCDARIAGWIFLSGLLLIILLHPLNAIVSNVIVALVFIGFIEEFFFRGYMQPRLNMAFEKKFNLLNLQFGWDIIITSALFGLIHVISPGENPMQWAWGFWTFVAGLGFGVVREKGGSFLAPAVVHGITMILPIVFS